MGGILQFFGTLFSPITTIFHYVFYLPIFNILMLLYDGVHGIAPGLPAFAIAIFLLTVLIRVALIPLTRKQLQSSRAMQALAPEVKKLQAQYKDNQQEFIRAQQALYREHGVSMTGGCLPLLVQLPFLYGLYYSLYTALIAPKPGGHPLPAAEVPAAMLKQINGDIYPFLPHLTLHTLPATAFLWTNLAAPDPLKILPILAGVLTFIQMRMALPVRKPAPVGEKPDPTAQSMQTMQFVMPFITVFIGLNFPSGLAFYWCITTAFMAVQQYFLSGWGSLFLGIPGLEHLVPAPQETPALPARPGSGRVTVQEVRNSGRQAGASAVEEDRPTGLGALRSMLRQLALPPPNTTDATPEASGAATGGKANGKTNGKANGKAASGEDEIQKVINEGIGASARRNRSDRSGPTLVKPAGGGATTGATGASGAAGRGANPARPAQGGQGNRGGQAARRRGGRPKGGR